MNQKSIAGRDKLGNSTIIDTMIVKYAKFQRLLGRDNMKKCFQWNKHFLSQSQSKETTHSAKQYPLEFQRFITIWKMRMRLSFQVAH